MKRKNTKRKPVEVKPFDLRQANPKGRVDCLAASVIERLASLKMPELLPLLDSRREVIHAFLNEQLGPHVVDLSGMVETVAPFMPLAGMLVQQLIAQSVQPKQAEQTEQPGGQAA